MPENNKDLDIPEMLGVRLEARTRYLAELAARASGVSLSTYVEQAIIASFEHVTLRKPTFPEPTYGNSPDDVVFAQIDEEREREKNASMSVTNLARTLWQENPFVRLEIRALSLPHLMTVEDKTIWNYIHSRDDLKLKDENGFRFDRELIAANWKSIKEQASKPQRRKK